MTDYVTLQNRIAMEVRTISTAAASDIGAQIKAAILSAVAHYERDEFWFNTTTNTFSTVADREYYSSSDLADIATTPKIISMTVTLNGVKLPVRCMDFRKIDEWQTGGVKGLPRYFAHFKQNIRLYPIPDDAYTVTMAYVDRLTALSSDGDSNAWTTDGEELIRCHAKADLYENLLKEYDAADRMRVRCAQVYSQLKRETRLRRSNDILRVDDALVAPQGYIITYQ